MSEPRLIEPLLSEYIMGDPISDRCGVRCCPAMHKHSEEKYMVKILSIPASEKQLDALLLSGACKDSEDAARYFRDLADEAVAEAELLQKLSRLEGFRGFDAWQIEPMQEQTGYDVYLLSAYTQTLERYMRRNCLTHLAAVNLGLDLCAALSVCRRNGWLYVDLKPENIFLSEAKGNLVGDLGFIRLSSLKYASLPEKYRSAYTAPEVEDAYSALNDTMDIYAAGLILYQVYNAGRLPQPGEPIAPPEYADYEMSEIILKACAADPADRWQDPQEMGQALVSYMQRNSVNDDPIIPPPVPLEPELPKEEAAEQDEEISDEESAADTPVDDGTDDAAKADTDTPSAEDRSTEIEVELPTPSDPVSEAIVEEHHDDIPEVQEEMEQIVIEGFDFTEDLQEEVDLSDLPEGEISQEVSEMLAQADDLISHKAPDPVVAPEPIEIPMPDPIPTEPEAEADPETEATDTESSEPSPEEVDEESDETKTLPIGPDKKQSKYGWITAAVIFLVLSVAAFFGGRYYYENEYLQHIRSVTLENAQNWLTVTLDTEIDNSLLTVHCTDTYGNKLSQPVENNRASFTGLASGCTYKVTVTISGSHQLTGDTTASFSTPARTSIVAFNAITGDTNGSVILNFSVQGPDASTWLVKYSADGEPELTALCTGHTAIITGLTPGRTYDFRLVPQDQLYVESGNTLSFTAQNVICAQNLAIQGFVNGALIATWDVPEGEHVDSWTVRCFNSNGVDMSFTVTEPSISIPDLDIQQEYTLDVTASGMTVSKWVAVSANSVTMGQIHLDDSIPGQLTITWDYEGTANNDGWTINYTVDGVPISTVKCEDTVFTLNDIIPGAHYGFEFVFTNGISVYGTTTAAWDSPEASLFGAYGVTAADMVFRMCRQPEFDGWSHNDLTDEDYTTQFTSGQSAAFVIRLQKEYQTSTDEITTLFLIRDQNGGIVSIRSSTDTWTSMWYKGYCELNLPDLPTVPGSYTVEVFFNNTYATMEPIHFTVE